MKNKTKLVLGLAALTAVTAGVATTSTFAWFTTSRSATVDFTSVTAYSDLSSLQVEYVAPAEAGDPNGTVTNNTDKQAMVVPGTGAKVTDVSGNGCAFFQKANANADYSVFGFASAANVYSATASEEKLYYSEFGVKFTNTGNEAMTVYLGSSTVISPKTSNDVNDIAAANSARMAVIDAATAAAATSASKALTVYQTAANYSSGTTKNLTYVAATTDTNSNITGAFATTDVVTSYTTYDTKAAATAASAVTIASLAAKGTKTVWVRIWLDGTAVACVSTGDNRADTGFITAKLGFYGLN